MVFLIGKCQIAHLGKSLREQGPIGSFSGEGKEGEENTVSKADVELSHERRSGNQGLYVYCQHLFAFVTDKFVSMYLCLYLSELKPVQQTDFHGVQNPSTVPPTRSQF